ncbi:hypothetical protein LCGC14_0295770 [marine sediment metagenome]|uniref:TGS domain-containing protein n=1 Tax=marine sediment metagenome TaxID=412755 RepID=A0A0F9U8T1_9ZZZZ|nr:redox-regulated ATPase YchF [Phycisphaerae bacterium]
MRVALVGPPQSGKSTLLAAIAAAGGSRVDVSRPDQPHLAATKVPDPRVDWLADTYHTTKCIHAELEFLDLPGIDLSDEAGRGRAKHHWPGMRQSDMIVFVVRAFTDDTTAVHRGRVDPAADVEELRQEMLFADLEQVTARIDKLARAVKKPTPNRDEQQRELDLMQRLAEALENEQPVTDVIANETEAKIVRTFALLSRMPTLVVVNCDEDQLDAASDSPETVRLSARIEREIAELDAEDRQAFLADLGLTSSAKDRLIRACYRRLDLISFLTHNDNECRAWTIPANTDAVTAAGRVHSDLARGFIRAETVAFDDLQAAGDEKLARAAGKIRLEGKSYVVQDGDVINFRFNV